MKFAESFETRFRTITETETVLAVEKRQEKKKSLPPHTDVLFFSKIDFKNAYGVRSLEQVFYAVKLSFFTCLYIPPYAIPVHSTSKFLYDPVLKRSCSFNSF